MGRWLNRDPIGEDGGNLYAMVRNATVNNTDLLGQLEITRNNKVIGKCGWFQTTVTFKGVVNGNWIIQFVKKSRKFTKTGRINWDSLTKECECPDCETVTEDEKIYKTFYEAFKKQPGIDKVDISSGTGPHKCTSGEVHNQKMAIYFGSMEENEEGCPKGFTRKKPNPTDGGGCYRNSKPDGWDTRSGAPALVVRYGFKGEWDCCPTEADTLVTDTNPSFESL